MSQLRNHLTASPAFVAAAAVLLIAAVGIHGTLWSAGITLLKDEAPLRKPLLLIEKELGPYQRVEQQRLPSEALEELGTDRYILWQYEDEDAEDAAAGRVHLLVAYYSGMPEARPRVSRNVQVVTGRSAGAADCRPVTLASAEADAAADTQGVLCVQPFTQPGQRDTTPVAYTYIVNGRMVEGPEQVHQVLTDPHAERAWWAKVEMRVDGAADADELRTAAARFLTHAWPGIAEALPAPADAPRERTGRPSAANR